MGIFGKSSWSRLKTSGSLLGPKPSGTALNSAVPNLDAALKVPPGTPDPRAWNLVRWAEVNGHLIVEVVYAGVENFEGRKIMVFDKGVRIDSLLEQRLLDPHFIEPEKSRYIHPIARLEPTKRGWLMAGALAESSEKWSNNK